MNWLIITLCGGLSIYAVIKMLQDTDGPFDIFLRFRVWVGVDVKMITVDDPYGFYIKDPNPDGFWAKLFSCKYCLSVWLAFLLWLGYISTGYIALWIILAPIGMAYLLFELDTHND